MIVKLLIYFLIALMFVSLGFSLYFMMKGGKDNNRSNVKALTARISIWVILFVLLAIGMATGYIIPSNSVIAKPAIEQSNF